MRSSFQPWPREDNDKQRVCLHSKQNLVEPSDITKTSDD